MTTAPVVDPGPPPSAPFALPTRTDRFFSWTAGLGLVRADGWLGGVAGGLAARVRVDPLIVRGILVVVALFGFPVLFLYAVAWALLPDLDGRIPVQDALRGRFSPALVGIAVVIVAGLVPASIAILIGLPTLFAWNNGVSALATVLFLVGALVAGGLIFLIVRAARTPGALVDQRTASAASEAPDASVAETGSGPVSAMDGRAMDALAFTDTASIPAPDTPAAPDTSRPLSEGAPDTPRSLSEGAPAPETKRPDTPRSLSEGAPAPETKRPEDTDPADPTEPTDIPADLAAWREQHAAWKEQDQAWRRQQQDAARAAREQARRERQARATAFSAEATERRRIRRATNPRAPFAYVAVVLGLAVVIGTLVALQHGGQLAPAFGLFVAALVLGGAMVLAGILRRRSGFLAFVTVLALVGGVAATAVPTALALHLGGYGISNVNGPSYPASAPFVQPWGDLTVYLDATGADGETYVQKLNGMTFITVMPGVEIDLEISTRSGTIYLTGTQGDSVYLPREDGVDTTVLPDGRTRHTATLGSGGTPATTHHRLVIDQDAGYIELYLMDGDVDDALAPDTEGDGQ